MVGGLLLGEQLLLQHDAELLAQGVELGKVLLVLLLVLDLGLDACIVLAWVSQSFHSYRVDFHRSVKSAVGKGNRLSAHTLEDPHSSGEVVDPPGGAQGGGADGGGGDQIIGEGVVQVALNGLVENVSPFARPIREFRIALSRLW